MRRQILWQKLVEFVSKMWPQIPNARHELLEHEMIRNVTNADVESALHQICFNMGKLS